MGNTLHLNKIIYILLLSSISIFGQIKLSELTLVNTLKQTDRFLVTQYLDSLDILTGDSVFQSRVVTWAWFQQYIADSVNFRVADTLDGNLTAGIDGTYTDGSSGSFTISGGIITGKTDPTQTHTTSVNNPTSTVAPGSTHWNVSTGEGWIYFPTNGWTMVY
jgi:hypothetical protein